MDKKKKTKSKKIENNKNRILKIIENISDVLVEIDSEMKFSYVSPHITNVFGFKPEELVNKSILDFIHPEDLESALERVGIAADGDNVIKFEFRTMHKDGHYVHVSSSGRMIEEGDDLKFVGVISDISERKTAEDALRASEEKFRTIVESVNDIMYIHDFKGKIIDVNTNACNMLGYKYTELVGQKLDFIACEEERKLIKPRMKDLIRKGKLVFEGEHITKKGNHIPVSISARVVSKEGEGIVQSFVRDISDLKESEESLKKAQAIAHIGSWEWDLTDNTFLLSDEMCRIYGLPETKNIDNVQATIEAAVHPDDKEFVYKAVERVMQDGSGSSLTYRVMRPDGEVRWIKATPPEVRHIGADGTPRVLIGTIEDITDRNRLVNDLKESEEKFRLISENTSDFIALTDLEGTYTYLSPSIERLGYKVKDLLGKSGFDFIHPDDVEKLMILLDNAIKSTSDKTKETIEFRFHNKAGDWHVLESAATLIKDKPGRSGRIIFISRDITDRNRLVNDLKEKSEFLDSVVNNISEGIFVLDEDFKYVFINPASGRIMDHDPKEWLGERAGSNLHPDDGEKSLKGVLQALEEGNSHCEIRVKASDGNYHDLDMKYTRMMWKDEIHLLGVVNDITESKVVDNILKESEAKYSAVVENSTDAILILQDGLVKYANSAVVKLSGYKVEELLDKDFLKFISPDQRSMVIDRYKDRLKGKDVPPIYDFMVLKKDGTSTLVEVSSSVITYEGREATLTLFRDISGRKKAEEALRDSEEKYRNIFDLSPETIMLVGLDGTILDCNNATTSLIGITKAELIGTSFIKMGLIFEEDISKYMNMFSQALKEEQVNPFDLKLDRGEGMIRWIEVFPTVIKKDGKTNAIQIIARDITERKRTELEMKKRLLSFDLEGGNIYLVRESTPRQSIVAFKELLEVGFSGIVISRTPLNRFEPGIERPFTYVWLSEKVGKNFLPPDLKEIESFIYDQPRGQAILIDGLSYLISKRGFDKCLSCVQSIMETVHLKDHIILLSVDPLTLSEKELRLLQKETVEIAPQMSLGKIPEKLLEVLRIVHKANIHGTKPSYSDVGLEAGLSKPTTRDRIRKLRSKGCVNEIVKGRNKYLEITEKGRNYMALK